MQSGGHLFGPGEAWPSVIIPPPDFRKDTPPYRVFITWEMTYKCNYKCSYCHYGGAADACSPPEAPYPGVGRLVEVWTDIFKRYGSCQIHLVGGDFEHNVPTGQVALTGKEHSAERSVAEPT